MHAWLCRSILVGLVLVWAPLTTAAALSTEAPASVDFGTYGQPAYAYLQTLDQDYWARDCLDDEQTERVQDWLITTLSAMGYAGRQIEVQNFLFQGPYQDDYLSQNIVVTLPGSGTERVVVGAHYDGHGAGDNASGVSVLLETAQRLIAEPQLPETVVFAFFGAEEETMAGSDTYVESLTEEELAHTAYYINIDSILCGDLCYVYGGVPDFDTRTVTGLHALDTVRAIGDRLGLGLHLVPWTFASPAPGFTQPEYPSPSTGNWSSHVSFIQSGIEYVYFEATNWNMPGPNGLYDGSGETAEGGKFMHTRRDTLAELEAVFPGRARIHMQVFSLLLHAVLTAF